jgi:uncharacterized protein (UPF0332 family)
MAREALDDAQFNLDGGRLRVASNRVYYAMFYAAVALLATRDLSSSRHAGVIALFYEHFVEELGTVTYYGAMTRRSMTRWSNW